MPPQFSAHVTHAFVRRSERNAFDYGGVAAHEM